MTFSRFFNRRSTRPAGRRSPRTAEASPFAAPAGLETMERRELFSADLLAAADVPADVAEPSGIIAILIAAKDDAPIDANVESGSAAGFEGVQPIKLSSTQTHDGGGIYNDGGVFIATGFTPGYLGGVNVAAGDVTGDGVADVITGEFTPVEQGFTGGVFVAAGDLNNDGRADAFAVGLAGDFNDDGLVDASDYAVWKSSVLPYIEQANLYRITDGTSNTFAWRVHILPQLEQQNVTEGRTAAGDYNGDGLVNAADYTVWRESRGSSVLILPQLEQQN